MFFIRIYLTHCSAKKDDNFRDSNEKTTPDVLYKSTPTKRFMVKCKEKGVNWAIFSDKYGVWFPDEMHEWYDLHPKNAKPNLGQLINNFDNRLEQYSEIWFYYNPGRFHTLYQELINNSKLNNRINKFSHLNDIT